MIEAHTCVAAVSATASGGTALDLPFDVSSSFGRARCPVRVTVNGHTWRATTQPYGSGFRVTVSAAARRAAHLAIGDVVEAHVRVDDAARTGDVPAELAAALRLDADARQAFADLPPSHQREYIRWVAQASQPQTRARRSEAAVERLRHQLARGA